MVQKDSRAAYVIILMGFLIRLSYVLFINPIDKLIYSDMSNYLQIADQIMKGIWKPTHFFQQIGFPLILVFLKTITPSWLSALQWIQLLAGTWSLWFVWQSTRVFWGNKIALIALIILSIHLPWITFTGLLLSESLFIFFLSLLLWVTTKLVKTFHPLYAIFWGLTFFGAFLIKGTHIFLGPLFVLSLYFIYKKSSFKVIALIAVVMSVGLVSHGILTSKKINHFQMSASAGGLNFVEGKCPIKNNADSAGYSWLSPLYHQLGMSTQKKWDRPFTDSGYFMKEGGKCILNNPYVLLQSFEGIPFLFFGNLLWPANHTAWAAPVRIYELFFAIFSITGLISFFVFYKKNKEEILVWVLPILSIFICVYIFKSEIRFRIPFDVWIVPLSVKGWSDLWRARATLSLRP